LAYLLEKVKHKRNMLFVFATNKLDKIPTIVSDRLSNRHFLIDLPGDEQRRSAINYWFSTLEKTEFNCEDNSFKTQFLSLFRKRGLLQSTVGTAYNLPVHVDDMCIVSSFAQASEGKKDQGSTPHVQRPSVKVKDIYSYSTLFDPFCSNSPLLTSFRAGWMQLKNNEAFKELLVRKTSGWSYRNIEDLFVAARGVAFKRAVRQKKSIVTIITQDFEMAFLIVKTKKKELELGYWGSTKKFCKDNPVLAGIIGNAIVASLSGVASMAFHHLFEFKPQMRQQRQLHNEAQRQSAAQHRENMSHARTSENMQLAGLCIAGASLGVGIATALDFGATGGVCTVACTTVAPYVCPYIKAGAGWCWNGVRGLWS
jgi:hypothetical protein